jgi:aspartate/methionine/tyrosine aminotransferase
MPCWTSDAMGYWESAPLKARICRHYAETYGVEVTPNRITLTCGASPALVLALSSTFKPGDAIAMARPGYVAYRNTVKALHMVPLEIACGAESRFQLTAATLAALDPAPAGVILASPANPTGTVIPSDELKAIAEVCRARGIRIISDEIYHGLSYAEPTHSMLEFEPSAIVVNSFSKYFSMAGWRLGWLIVPPEQASRSVAYMGALFLTAPSLAQHAALVAMDCRDELEGHVETYRRNRELLLDALPALGLEKIAPPDGAFYIYADVGRLTDDSLAFCKQLLQDTGVATAPGIDFDPVDGRRFIRMSFAVSTPLVEEAIRRLIPWFEGARARSAA